MENAIALLSADPRLVKQLWMAQINIGDGQGVTVFARSGEAEINHDPDTGDIAFSWQSILMLVKRARLAADLVLRPPLAAIPGASSPDLRTASTRSAVTPSGSSASATSQR
jgi:hypothetical protein